MKLKFHQLETKVSKAWNCSFSPLETIGSGVGNSETLLANIIIKEDAYGVMRHPLGRQS